MNLSNPVIWGLLFRQLLTVVGTVFGISDVLTDTAVDEIVGGALAGASVVLSFRQKKKSGAL